MKNYIVEDKITDLTNNTEKRYYYGKDGYIWEDAKTPDGYSSFYWADRKVREEKTWLQRNYGNEFLESGRWLHTFTIIEREDNSIIKRTRI